MDKNSAEYKTVINLYNDGKITEEERDKLLEALGFDVDRRGRRPDADDIFSDGGIYVNLSDDGDEEEDDDEPEDFHIDIDDERSLGEFLSGLGKKISSSAKSGLKTASAALEKASDKLRGAAKKTSSSANSALEKASEELRGAAKILTLQVADELGNVKLDSEVEKRKGKSYKMPYDELEIKVRYMNGETSYNISESACDAHKIKAYFESKLDGKLLKKLEEVLDSGFTGKYVYMMGEDLLKITVAPPEDDD